MNNKPYRRWILDSVMEVNSLIHFDTEFKEAMGMDGARLVDPWDMMEPEKKLK